MSAAVMEQTAPFRMPARSLSWHAQDSEKKDTATHALVFFNRKERGELTKDPVTGEWNGWFRWKGKEFISVEIELRDGYETMDAAGNAIAKKFFAKTTAAGAVW